MRIKQLLSVLLAVALLTASFSACGSWMPEETTTGPEAVSETESETESDVSQAPPVEVTLPEPTTEEPTTKDPLAGTGVTELDAFVPMPLNKEGVMEMYKSLLDDVKLRCPGFTRKQEMITQDVTAGKGSIQLANRILQLVATEIIKSAGDADGNVTVKPHSDLEVRAKFPAYGENEGCTLTNYDIVKTAAAYTDGKTQKLIITLEDVKNAEPGKGDFSKIMTPISRENIANGIAEYFVVLDKDSYKYDFNYTGNEIVCEADAQTGRLLSLTQKSVVGVAVDLDMDLILFKTNFIKAHGTIINRWTFSDFVWD